MKNSHSSLKGDTPSIHKERYEFNKSDAARIYDFFENCNVSEMAACAQDIDVVYASNPEDGWVDL